MIIILQNLGMGGGGSSYTLPTDLYLPEEDTSKDVPYREYEPELIGYMPYETVNANARHESYPDGSFVLELWRQSASSPEPYIKVAMSKAGKRITMLEEKGQHVFKTVTENGFAIYNLVIAGAKDLLEVGNYVVEALVEGRHHVKKHVTIIDSPFATGRNSEYLPSIREDFDTWVLKGEYPINGSETGVEVKFYYPMFRAPNWISAALYDENNDPVSGTEVRITNIGAESFQIEFFPAIPASSDWTLVYAAWV